MVIIFWDVILFLPKVKRSKIINNKHGINPLPQEMPNEALKKISELYRIIAWCPVSPPSPTQNKNSINASNKLLKNSTWTFPIVGYFTWKLEFVSNTLWNTSNLMASQKINVIGSFNYISYRLTSFGTLVMKGDSFFFPFSFEVCPIDGRSSQFGTFWFLPIRTESSWWFCQFQIWFQFFQNICIIWA